MSRRAIPPTDANAPPDLDEPKFAMVPPELLRDTDLPDGPAMLLVYLLGCLGKRGDPEKGFDATFYWRPTEAARFLNCDTSAVRYWRRALEKRAILYGERWECWLEISNWSGGYLMPIRLGLASMADLQPNLWRTWAVLESCADAHGVVRQPLNRIAALTGTKRRETVIERLRAIEDAGWLAIHKSPNPRARLRLVLPRKGGMKTDSKTERKRTHTGRKRTQNEMKPDSKTGRKRTPMADAMVDALLADTILGEAMVERPPASAREPPPLIHHAEPELLMPIRGGITSAQSAVTVETKAPIARQDEVKASEPETSAVKADDDRRPPLRERAAQILFCNFGYVWTDLERMTRDEHLDLLINKHRWKPAA